MSGSNSDPVRTFPGEMSAHYVSYAIGTLIWNRTADMKDESLIRAFGAKAGEFDESA